MALADDASAPADRQPDPIAGQERYRALIETSAAIVWRADADGVILEASSRSERTGRTRPVKAGVPWLDALHPDDRDHGAEAWRLARIAGELKPHKCRLQRADGRYHWAIARARALRGENGVVSEWIGTLTDIQDSVTAAAALRESEELLRLAIEATGLGIWELEVGSRRTRWTPELKALAGLPDDAEVDDEVFYGLVHADDRDAVEEKITIAVAQSDLAPYQVTYRLSRADTGELRWLHEWGRLIADGGGKPKRIVGAIQDITEHKRLEIELHAAEERWRLALDAGGLIAWERPLDTDIFTPSGRGIALLGVQVEHFSAFLERVHPEDRAALLGGIGTLSSGRRLVTEYRYRRPDGREVWLESNAMLVKGNPDRIVGTLADITDKKAAEAHLVYAASRDVLTGLLNRRALQAELDQAIEQARREQYRIPLLLLDIDQFKDVNDTVGHDAGDALLRVTADRLRALVGERGIVARLGGDEFAVVLAQEERHQPARRMADQILRTLAEPFAHRGQMLRVTVSVGIACFPDHHEDATELLKDADLALYAAKADGRNRARFYDPAMRSAVEGRLNLARDMRAALAADQIVPFYQPKIDMVSSAIIGFEALARWQHPSLGVLTPHAFAPAFQDAELAVAIEEAMLRQVLRDIAGWLGRGLDCGRIALNLCSHALRAPHMAERILAQVASAGVPADRLAIEVTEMVLLDGRAEDIGATLRQFRDAGVTISLDDFGTGYASLTHLKRFPVDEIKIDQSFVRDLEADPDDAAIVTAVIGLGRSLGLKTVAEGVETAGQAEKLEALGCDFGQGYHYARPMAGTRVPWALAQSRARAGEAATRLRTASRRR